MGLLTPSHLFRLQFVVGLMLNIKRDLSLRYAVKTNIGLSSAQLKCLKFSPNPFFFLNKNNH